MPLGWGYMFLPLISEQLKIFWQCKNKLSYKVPTNREGNENIQFFKKKPLNLLWIFHNCKGFQDNPQAPNFSIIYFTYYEKTFIISNRA